jgi:hypothetical protein
MSGVARKASGALLFRSAALLSMFNNVNQHSIVHIMWKTCSLHTTHRVRQSTRERSCQYILSRVRIVFMHALHVKFESKQHCVHRACVEQRKREVRRFRPYLYTRPICQHILHTQSAHVGGLGGLCEMRGSERGTSWHERSPPTLPIVPLRCTTALQK